MIGVAQRHKVWDYWGYGDLTMKVSGTQQVLGLTAASAAAAGSSTGCPAGPPIVIHDPSKPVLLLPNTTYQFLAGRFVLATTLTLQQGQSCCITGSSNGSRTILLPPKPAAAAGNSTAQQQLHFKVTGGRLVLHNLTVSGYAGGSYRGGGGVLIQRAAGGAAAGDEGGVTPAGTGATLVADNVTFSHISPRAVANIDDTAAAITLRDTSFVGNNHSGVACYDWWGSNLLSSWHEFQCYLPNTVAGAAGLSTVSNVSFWGVTRFVGNTWGALQSRGTKNWRVWITFNGPLLLLNNSKPATGSAFSDVFGDTSGPFPPSDATAMPTNGGRFACIGNAAECDGSCLYMEYDSTVLFNGSASCITGNTAMGNSSNGMCVTGYTLGQPLHGPVMGALSITRNSSVRFIGHGHRMGGNQGNGSSADIVVYESDQLGSGAAHGHAALSTTSNKAQAAPLAAPAPTLGTFNGFACDDQAANADGVYVMAGDVLAQLS
ncbi:hypothetical protein OEZ85_004843 [Tetradesmus obliquus]|uniref:Right handed beta helix domain-containing protein n=1 Tax=Tetradesmus obliquus TaxID=3088 RepID=A0ABY8UGP0_TETOB|nr:hypothetical protein OEZ85_004843 [Tetradesmus obliquus]